MRCRCVEMHQPVCDTLKAQTSSRRSLTCQRDDVWRWSYYGGRVSASALPTTQSNSARQTRPSKPNGAYKQKVSSLEHHSRKYNNRFRLARMREHCYNSRAITPTNVSRKKWRVEIRDALRAAQLAANCRTIAVRSRADLKRHQFTNAQYRLSK